MAAVSAAQVPLAPGVFEEMRYAVVVALTPSRHQVAAVPVPLPRLNVRDVVLLLLDQPYLARSVVFVPSLATPPVTLAVPAVTEAGTAPLLSVDQPVIAVLLLVRSDLVAASLALFCTPR